VLTDRNQSVVELQNSLRRTAPLVTEGNYLVEQIHNFSRTRNLFSRHVSLQKFHKGLTRLEQRCRVAREKQKLLDLQISQLCIDYGRATRRPLCDAMGAALPRELRDIIYQYTFDSKRVTVVRHAYECDCMSSRDPYRVHTYRAEVIAPSSMPASHLRDVEYMGNLSKEIVETWYRSATFIFDACGSFPTFLQHDLRGHGVQPGLYINHVEFQIMRLHLDREKDTQGTMRRASNIAEGRKALCGFKERATVDIIIIDVSLVRSHLPSPGFLQGLNEIVSEIQWQQRHSKRTLKVSLMHDEG
jgi:hypothetical protein